MAHEARFYHGLWFIPGGDRDWLGQLFKANGRWHFHYRFRYYAKDRATPFDGKDTKNEYRCSGKDDSEGEKHRLIAIIENVCDGLQNDGFGGPADFLRLECSNESDEMLNKVKTREWCHVRIEEKPS